MNSLRIVRLMLACSMLLAAGPSALADSSSADLPHVHVQLLVLPQVLARGGAAEAGIYFKLEPGWHVYWMNPGDAGEPPRVRWTLPAGITAGPLQFPAPKRLPLGPLMDFGYEDEVLFPLTLNVASSAKDGSAALHAKLNWLVCRGSCIPEKTELEISRDVAEPSAKSAPSASDAAIFQKFAERIPKPMPASYKVGFQNVAGSIRLTVETGQRETEAAFFPVQADVFDNPAPQKFAATAKGLSLDLKKDANLKANPAQLSGVVELSGGRAFEFVVRQGTPAAGSSHGSRW